MMERFICFFIYLFLCGCELKQYLCLVFVDGGQQFLLLPECMVYRTLPPHHVVVLHLYETRLVHWG